MKEDFVNELGDYFSQRVDDLESKIISGAYTAANGSEALVDGLRKYNLTEPITHTKYESLNGKMRYLRIDSNGLNRQSKEDSNETVEITDLSNLISEELYSTGKKGKVLRTIIYSIFDDFGFRENIMPKEVMNLMEKIFNVTFKSDDSSKVYINPKTFSSVFYDVKKKVLESSKTRCADYDSIKNLGTILLRQEGIDKSEKIELNLARLDKEKLIRMIPSFNDLKDETIISGLSPMLAIKRDYSMKSLMSEELSELVYPQLFTKLYNRTMKRIYLDSLKKLSEDEVRLFCKKNQELLEFDSQDSLKEAGGKGIIMMLGHELTEIIGGDNNGFNEMVISGKLIEHLATASDTYSQISLKQLKGLLSSSEEEKMRYLTLCQDNLFSQTV